jgi:iron complex outermembrane receptor protein
MHRIPRRRRLACLAAILILADISERVGAQSRTAPPPDSVLDRRISISIVRKPLAEVFVRLRQDCEVAMAWSGDVVPDTRVSITFNDTPVRDVLSAILDGTELEYAVTRLGTILIVPRRPAPESRAMSPVPGSPQSAAQTLVQTLGATGVRQLDAVVVIGNAVAPGPERDQPTAIGIVRPSQLSAGSYSSVSDIIRTRLPGVVLWDRGPVGPTAPVTALRGVSSFTTRAVKTYVDGIELASPELFTLLDPRSIDRIELIRGPQGAALYGPDALNGILRIETLHGRFTPEGVRVRGAASAGGLSRDDFSGTELVQDYSAGVTGSKGLNAFDVGGAFRQTGFGGEFPRLRSWSANAGARSVLGRFVLEASARSGRREYSVDTVNSLGNVISGARRPRAIEERGAAVSVIHSPGDRVRQTLILGYHHTEGVREAFHSPLLAPVLPLGATDEAASRGSVRYGLSVDATDALTFAAGAEHSRLTIDRTASGPSSLYLKFRHLGSTGAFAQARARIGTRLVVSAGIRGEDATSVDSRNAVLWASTAGLSWSHELPVATVRLRAAWGNGIRPPEPGMKDSASRGTALVQLANPDLVAERQVGVEGGVDVYFPGGGYLKFTAYEQHALDLIQAVVARNADTSGRTYAFQNVGRILNRGTELEAGYQFRGITTSLIAYFPGSRVTRLGRAYTGELRVGDELLEVPEAVGSWMLGYEFRRVRAELGASWMGSWIGFDRVAIQRAEHQQQLRRETTRDYWRRYDDVFRPYVSVTANLAPYNVFLRIDNFGNPDDVVRDNLSPTLGRTIMIGLARRE